MNRRALLCGGVALLAGGLAPAWGQEGGLRIEGRVAQPRRFSLAELQALAPTTIEVTHLTAKGPQSSRYTGALLWPLMEAAGPVDASGPRTRLQHSLLATGQDGYAVVLALAELDPAFEGKPVLVAYAQDDKPLAGLHLVVPNDHRAGRSVRDLVSIEVR